MRRRCASEPEPPEAQSLYLSQLRRADYMQLLGQ